jgi:hypothetical protein
VKVLVFALVALVSFGAGFAARGFLPPTSAPVRAATSMIEPLAPALPVAESDFTACQSLGPKREHCQCVLNKTSPEEFHLFAQTIELANRADLTSNEKTALLQRLLQREDNGSVAIFDVMSGTMKLCIPSDEMAAIDRAAANRRP